MEREYGMQNRKENGFLPYMSLRSQPLDLRENSSNYPMRKSPHLPLRNLYRNMKRDDLSGQDKRKLVIKACKGFLAQNEGPFRGLRAKLYDTPDLLDVADSLITMANSIGEFGYSKRLNQEYFN